jgi:KEOPS complex subunit Pcc1
MLKRVFATCKIRFPEKRNLDIVLAALKPEVDKPITTRSKVSLNKNGEFLLLKVEAGDTVALRAALNAYLRWINSTLDVLDVIKT